MYIKCIIKCVKYWLKLLSLPDESLLGACYYFLYNQSLLGKTNWCSKIKEILFKYGFGWAWEDQGVPDDNLFMKMFSKRLKDCELQAWATDIQNMPKLRIYNLFKETRNQELYLSLSIPRRLRLVLAQFRTGNHKLEIEIGRHRNLNTEDRLCKFCELSNINVIEDEYHVIFHCPAYNDIRNVYLGKETSVANMHNFVSILKTTTPENIVNLAHFISSMFKARKTLQ
jgi:hypothetical protein